MDPPPKWKMSTGAELPVSGDYMRYNRLIGGIRFRQEVGKASEDECYFPGTASKDVWNKWYGKPCFPIESELAFTPDTSDSEGFGKPDRVEWMLIGADPLER